MPVFNNILAGAAGSGGAAGDFKIERSLRFNDADTGQLSRTPSSAASGNQKLTYSVWVKGADLSDKTPLFSASSSGGSESIEHRNDGSLVVFFDEWSNGAHYTSAKFRDPSAWYHFVFVVDTTLSTAADRVKIYVNGERVSTTISGTLSQNHTFSGLNQQNKVQYIGRTANTSGGSHHYASALFAEIHMIDGQALAPTDFGKVNATTGAWDPIEFTGTHGNNGFHLNFSDTSSNASLGNDAAGSNNWNVTNLVTSVSSVTPPKCYEADALYTTVADIVANGTLIGTNGIGGAAVNNKYCYIVHNDFGVIGSTVFSAGWSTSFAAHRYEPSTNTWTNTGGYNTSASEWQAWLYEDDGTESSYELDKNHGTGFTFAAARDSNNAPARYTGTYPTLDITNMNTLASANAGSDVSIDSPTNYEADSGDNPGNYATLSPIDFKGTQASSLSDGNLKFVSQSGGSYGHGVCATIAASSGKYYWETTIEAIGSGQLYYGVSKPGWSGDRAGDAVTIRHNGAWYNNLSGATVNAGSLSALAVGDVIGFALNLDDNQLSVSVNGTFHASANPATGANPNVTLPSNVTLTAQISDYTTGTTVVFNFGARPFTSPPPTGFKSLCAQNLPDPLISKGSDYFNALPYTGDGATSERTITGLSLASDPDWIWVKSRVSTNGTHLVWDSVRGGSLNLSTDDDGKEYSLSDWGYGAITGSTSGGIKVQKGSLANAYNVNEYDYGYVAWCWDGGDLATNSAYNQSQVWSSGTQTNPDTARPLINLFDNDTVTLIAAASGNDASSKVTLPASITAQTSVRYWSRAGGYNNGPTTLSNSGTTVSTIAAEDSQSSGWKSFTGTFPMTFNEITFNRSSDGTGSGAAAIEVDGKVLVDKGLIPVGSISSGVPSIASTCRTNQTAGISIIKYDGSGSAGTIAHNLNAQPHMVIVKNRTTDGYNWKVLHKDLTGFGTNMLSLDDPAGETAASASWFNSTAPTSSVISLGSLGAVNASNEDYICYAFTSVEGYSLVSSYQANGSDDGTFVPCGFRPKFLLLKSVNYSADWLVVDASRDPNNPAIEPLFPNRNYYEGQASTSFKVDILSNGFKLRHADGNAEGYNYVTNPKHVFYAVAENPFKYARAR